MTDPSVLVVDDTATLRFLYVRGLKKMGLVADCCADGNEAVQRFTQWRKYELILMDVMMPELDGYGATRQIREIEMAENCGRVPIVGITCVGNRRLCIDAGMDDYYQKPILQTHLSAIVLKWVHEPRSNWSVLRSVAETFPSIIEGKRTAQLAAPPSRQL